VDWGKDSKGNKDTCFKLDYARMILTSMSKHIEKMNPQDVDNISYEPITLVRFRPRSIEYHRKVKKKTETGQEVIEIQEAGAYNVREGSYEDRETMVKNALGAYVRYVPEQNNSQVQQPNDIVNLMHRHAWLVGIRLISCTSSVDDLVIL